MKKKKSPKNKELKTQEYALEPVQKATSIEEMEAILASINTKNNSLVFDDVFHYINLLKKMYDQGKISDAIVIANFIQCVCAALNNAPEKINRKSTNVSWINSVAEKELHFKLRKIDEAYDMGHLVEGLIFFGSPRIHAITSIAEWMNCSETKIRTAHQEYRKMDKVPWKETIGVLITYQIMHSTNRPFPQNPPKAADAFQKLKKFIEEEHDLNRETFEEFMRNAVNYPRQSLFT